MWIGCKRSQAVILVEYTGARMKDMDAIRAKVREFGGEFHVVKNTLVRRALKQQGMTVPDEHLLAIYGDVVCVLRSGRNRQGAG